MKALALLTTALLVACQSPDVDDRDASPPAKDGTVATDAAADGSAPADAQVQDAADDAFLPAPDMGPGCVAPTAGECPPDVEEILRGRQLTSDLCFAREEEIVSCLYNPGGTAGMSCARRTTDDALFALGAETCRPEGWAACTPEEFEAVASQGYSLCP
jgi:hypothetical protein